MYRLKGAHIEWAIKIIGLIVSTIFGLLAFKRGLDYAEVNLPQQLIKLNERLKKLALHDRAIILASYSARNLKGDTTHAEPQVSLGPLLRLFRTDSREKSVRRLRERVGQLEEDIPVLVSNLAKCKTERITVHLLDGADLAAQANAMERDTSVQISTNEAALAEFRKAVKLDDKDLDALEHGARQARRLNFYAEMRNYLDMMHTAAQEQGRPVRVSRALRFQAEVLEESSGKSAKRDARTKLDRANRVLDDPDGQSTGAEKLFELALVNEQLGALHLVRGTPTLVKPSLDYADELYGRLSGPEGAAGHVRILQLRSRLEQAEQGGDDPDDTEDADQADPNFPTHVNPKRLIVLEAPNGRRAHYDPVPPFTRLRVKETRDKFALIERGGVPLGYVPEGEIQVLGE